MRITCKLIEPGEVLALRSQVLRAGWPPDDCVYSNDHKPTTFHAGALDESGVVVGVVSFHVEPYPHEPIAPALRFQGMAVAPSLQSTGIGSTLLSWALDHARSLEEYELVWCAARTPALSFYKRLGFEEVGDEFTTEWGPHYLMFRSLEA